MPATSGVITTPDVLIVKLLPDQSMIAMLAGYSVYVIAVIVVFCLIQETVGVSRSLSHNSLRYVNQW